jgi:hypothetical protein
MSVVYIGRSKVNLPNDTTPTLIINEECISSFHAILELCENDTIQFSDRNSSNGVFKIKSVEKDAVYKQLDKGTFSKNRIQKGTLHPDEALVFGRIIRSFDELKELIRKITNAPINNWIKEFNALESVYTTLASELKRVKQNHNIVGHSTRAGLALGLSWAVTKIPLGGEVFSSPIMLTLPPVLQMLDFPNGSLDEKLWKIRKKYEPLYRCPKCFTPFREQQWIEIKSNGCQARCGAIFK